MYKFILRPAYGSNELLIEIISSSEKDNFISELEKALCSIKIVIIDSKDLWVNDELLFTADSDFGIFQISIDNLGMIFIMAKENQKIIKKIDFTLNENENFEKELVDFKNYTLKHD